MKQVLSVNSPGKYDWTTQIMNLQLCDLINNLLHRRCRLFATVIIAYKSMLQVNGLLRVLCPEFNSNFYIAHQGTPIDCSFQTQNVAALTIVFKLLSLP